MKLHNFHIPVMGIGYTIDSPIKVAAYGIDSVISLVDDKIIEQMRKYYSSNNSLEYTEITDKENDYRANRITSYLNLVNKLVSTQLNKLKSIASIEDPLYKKFISLLPNQSDLKKQLTTATSLSEVLVLLKNNCTKGGIDVNIMTKVDKANFVKGEELPTIYNDAHAALRGYANSDLESGIVFSAGLNPRLYSYISEFEDFYPDADGNIKKKIILKVSDYRSAIIQGKFLAKKGLWVSEYRIESGLNCGGHAFATNGSLLGPVLKEFKENREELIATTNELMVPALEAAGKTVPKNLLKLQITAQGGVGTHEEHDFLVKEYNLDSIGWGSPFLLVPEATTIDKATLTQLEKAKEEDLVLSDISPLGVRFNNLKGATKDTEKANRILRGKPGSPCTKKHVALNYEFSKKGLCIASRKYQDLKLKEIDKNEELSAETKQAAINKVIDKSCICVGLGTSALLNYNISTGVEGDGVSICPGPNMAYFTKESSLTNMTQHIYGGTNVMEHTSRPNLFVKELDLYVSYLQEQLKEYQLDQSVKAKRSLNKFANNLLAGISYYKTIFTDTITNAVSNEQTLVNYEGSIHKVLLAL
ncbi:hypothetical protein N9901_02180 [Flavobacteriaceae bacterium]|nr:hypothetical protein [Flavobacteriaceae bacterium]